jgi:hypothetical protein
VVVERWVLSTHSSLDVRVAGLRFLLACLDCWLFNYPLTDAPWIESLGLLATEGLADAPLAGDPAPNTREALLTEAQHSYALGRVTWPCKVSHWRSKASNTAFNLLLLIPVLGIVLIVCPRGFEYYMTSTMIPSNNQLFLGLIKYPIIGCVAS